MLAGFEEAFHAWKSFQVSSSNTPRAAQVSRDLRSGSAIETVLAGLIDYAGLYPPASLDMRRAVANYLTYRSGRHSSILGRFIVDVSRIDEIRAAVGKDLASVRLSLILPFAGGADLAALIEEGLPIESVEIKAPDVPAGALIATNIPEHLETYTEWPIDMLDEESFAPHAGSGARIKLRM